MKKIAIGAMCTGALAAAGLLATSYYSGIQLQEAFEQNIEAWSTEDGFSVQVLQYDRGWLRSQAQTLWTFAGEDEAYEITANHDILHGPWPMGKAGKVVSRFELPADSEPELAQALKQQAPLTWTALADWSGATTHSMHSPAFSANFEDGSTLTWGGLQADWSLSAARDHTQGAAHIPLLRVQTEDGSLINLEDSDLRFNTQQPQGHAFWLGPSTFTVGAITLQDPDKAPAITLQDLAIETNNSLQDHLVQAALNLQLAKMEAPHYQASNMVLQVRLKNMDADWMDQFMAWAQSGYEASQMDWLRNLPQLLAAQPEFSIPRWSMESSEGPVSLSARLAYVGQQPEAFNPEQDLEGQLQAALPRKTVEQLIRSKVRRDYEALLEQMQHEIDAQELQAAIDDGVEKRLASLIQLGLLEPQTTQAQWNLEFSQGRFKLNNHPQTLQQLLSLGNAL